MSRVLNEVLAANTAFAASFGDQRSAPSEPRFAILTCMDARLDPAKFAGLGHGDAHVIRNAGGRASDDAIRSLVVSYKLLGTTEFFVIHHTDCIMESVSDEMIQGQFASRSNADVPGSDGFDKAGSGEVQHIRWLTIVDQRTSVVDDIRRIRNHPLVPARIPVHGLLYDVGTGRLGEVPEAITMGGAS